MPQVTSVIKKELYPKVEKSLKINKNKWKNLMSNFFQARAASLYDIAPIDRMFFRKDDEDALFSTLNISKQEVTEILQKTYYYNEIKNKYTVLSKDEHAMLSLTIIRYFVMIKDKKNLELAVLYLAFTGKIYASAHSRSFNFTPENYRHVMEYAVNNMSNKFDLVRTGSVIGAVRVLCETWLESYDDRIKNYNDEDVSYIIQQLQTRVESFIKNVAKEFYTAFDNREYITYDSDNVSSDEYHLADSDSLKLEKTIDKAIIKLETTTTDFSLCKQSSDQNVRTDELRGIIDSILTNPENFELVKELIRNICTYYFINSKSKDVRNIDFLTFSLSPKPNAKDTLYLRNREIIEQLLLKNSNKYKTRSKRAATKISYNTAVLKYFVLFIVKANK